MNETQTKKKTHKKANKKASKKTSKNQNPIKVIPLGGLDTIGRNMTLFEYKDEILIVDCGIMFPTPEMPGVDFIIPDFDYVKQNKSKVKGIIITHGHEDHIGAVSFLLDSVNVPIFGTKLTLGLIKMRLVDRGCSIDPKFIEIEPGEIAQIGKFSVDFIRVNHSIMDGVGLAITTDIGTIIHTGDFKIDYSPVDGKVTDMHHFAEYGRKGVLLMLSDSTNAECPGYTGSEAVISEKLSEIFSLAKGRILVATFASNISRIQQILDACRKYNRKVVISGRSMQNNIEIARDLGYLNYKDDILVTPEETNSIPDKRLTIICTGTQGEPMSALTRMANGTHRHFTCGPGDRVILTASVIPGNERTVGLVINSLMQLGAHVHYEQDVDIHVSGHASKEELKLMLSLVRPKYFIPIHGEYKFLKAHTDIAESLGMKASNCIIAGNGDIIEMTQDRFEKVDKLKLKDVFIDGKIIGDLSSDIISDRQTMSTEGVVFVTLVFAENLLVHQPMLVTKGFAEFENEKIINMLNREIHNTLQKIENKKINEKEIAATVKRNLKNMTYRAVRRNPLIEVQVIAV